ncbi:MAG: Dihydrolipoamide acetyltransferase component of pyruvate dehydrogenase complex [Gammaproteobacteria bacterium]|jgi:pyruvate dehydrogenase E2 component (dihydrolipoamide acetyltransferase)|nr:Dihydrolipoamide acetyltransferase component of pyruvate dehydrogenase complex [Gammaproteobacteria bacterium]
MAIKEVAVPDIGNYKNVDVIELSVKVGDSIKEEQSLMTLETDKATMEIPAPFAGTVKEVLVKVGSKVSQGTLILKVDTEVAAAKTEAPAGTRLNEAAAPAAKASSASQEIRVPDIGNYKNVDVIEVNIKAGGSVKAEQTLITIETDKATMEIPAPFACSIDQLKVKVGDKVSQGDLIALVKAEGAQAEAPKAAEPAAMPAPAKVEIPVQAPAAAQTSSNASAHAGPSVRRMARELGVELSRVQGTGRKGRISTEDLANFVKSNMGASGGAGLNLLADPTVDFAQFGEVEAQKLSRIKKISGANLHRNWVKIPHITLCEEADITELEAFRNEQKAQAEKAGVKLTPLAFLLKAVATALKCFPNVNASLGSDGETLFMKKYIHIGVAVDTPNGLMVPVIRDVDQKGIYQLAKELAEISVKAREGKLKPADMQGGCFTISSLGGIGTTYFTPIVNMPEVGILGVSKAAMKPVWNGKEFMPRLMMPLSLSVDHRVVDGAEGAKFVVTVAKYLSDIRNLLL